MSVMDRKGTSMNIVDFSVSLPVDTEAKVKVQSALMSGTVKCNREGPR